MLLLDGSHATTAIQYAALSDYKSIDEIKNEIMEDYCDPLNWVVDKYGIVAIWNNGYVYNGKLNRLQKRSISILQENDLMRDDTALFKTETHEYRNYLKRKETELCHN